MKKNLFIFILFLLTLQLHAQTKQGNISGIVKDNADKPVAFANAVLLQSNDSSLVKGAITDENGKFIFEGITPGSFNLVIAQVGYKKYSEPVFYEGDNLTLPPVMLGDGAVNLKEATIESVKPFIEHRVDRTVVNIENSIVNSGSTVLEILKRSPGISVDNNDNVSLKGKQGVQIMIDGKLSYLTGSDLTNLLKNMHAEELSQIEIITNPSAKYDAAGNSGIINIKLRKKQNLGFNGSLNASYGQGVYPDFNTGINMNYRNEKFNAFGNYHYGQQFYFENNTLIRRFKETDYTAVFDQRSYGKTESENQNIKAGVDYFINSKHTIGFLMKGNFNTSDDKTTSTTQITNQSVLADSGYTTINTSDRKWNNYTLNLNHSFTIDTLGKELTTDLDYAHYDTHSDNNFNTRHFSPDPLYIPYVELERNNQPAKITVKSAKIDYAQPFGKNMKLETGVKSSYVTTDNDVKYYSIIDNQDIIDTGKTNHFNYTENINAVYVNWSGEFGKWGMQAGLRGEQTISKGEQITASQNFKRDYIQLFPSAFLSYKLNKNNQFGLNYSRRIDRPAYQQLNPFRYFLDPNTYEEGNPNLQPQFTHSFELSHTFMDVVTTTINYSHTTNAMTDISKQIDSTRTTFVTTENFESHDNYGLSVSIPFQVTKWWLTSNNINVFNNRFTGITSGINVDKQLTTYMVNTDNSFQLPGNYAFELSAYYNSKMVWATFLIDPQYSVSAGFSKKFFDKRLNLKVDINDIFKTEKTIAKVNYGNINFDFQQLEDSQFVRFHLTYNFGKRTVEQARRRHTGAEDELNRVKTGK
ncbi:MAG TPA: TonB-dependent receptor [Bacteroidia bacterium]|nr:TonB-dependent receptor [Bacteroidia bacterium]